MSYKKKAKELAIKKASEMEEVCCPVCATVNRFNKSLFIYDEFLRCEKCKTKLN